MGNKHSLGADRHYRNNNNNNNNSSNGSSANRQYQHPNHHYPHSVDPSPSSPPPYSNGTLPTAECNGNAMKNGNGGGVGGHEWRGTMQQNGTVAYRQQQQHREVDTAKNRHSSPPLGLSHNSTTNSDGKKTGFLAQLFQQHKHQKQQHSQQGAGEAAPNNSPTAAASPHQTPVSPHPNGRQMHAMLESSYSADHPRPQHIPSPQHQPFVLLPDRPAIRLDSRLVCKYEVLSVVGKGSFSQVLRVQDRLSKRYYAVKLVSTETDFGAVNNELSILSRVQHPFVIRLEEVFRSATKLFIVMEIASGGEMYDRVVNKGRYTEGEARLAIKMLLTGLDYLHQMNITHRDLKPENLLYSDPRPDARLLITDFGLAHQAQGTGEKMAETCGTPEYIAPEILLRIPYTNKVDLWAVGVIAYILMSGIMPFDDDCRSRLYTHIITANYVYYPKFWSAGEDAKHFVDTLLDTSPEHRPTASEAMRHFWVTGNKASTLTRRQMLKRDVADEMLADDDADSDANGTTVQRTKSSRSIRSVTRSDHGHRVDPREVDQLAEDLQKIVAKQREQKSVSHRPSNGHRPNGSTHHSHYNSHYGSRNGHHQTPITKDYGVI